jgi:hypothetical protein
MNDAQCPCAAPVPPGFFQDALDCDMGLVLVVQDRCRLGVDLLRCAEHGRMDLVIIIADHPVAFFFIPYTLVNEKRFENDDAKLWRQLHEACESGVLVHLAKSSNQMESALNIEIPVGSCAEFGDCATLGESAELC